MLCLLGGRDERVDGAADRARLGGGPERRREHARLLQVVRDQLDELGRPTR